MPDRLKHEPVPASEHGQIRSYLASRGVTGQALNDAVGANEQGQTRDGLERRLAAWLRQRPRG